MSVDRIDLAKANPEIKEGMPPVLRFNYAMPHAWAVCAEGMLKKYNWQPRTHLSTFTEVKQVDDDTISFYRRHESSNFIGQTWEKVTINRATKEVTSEVLGANNDKSTYVIERTSVTEGSESQSNVRADVFDVACNGNVKVEVFKNQCRLLLQAIRFNEWSQQE